jgi:hypothetical protein
MGRSAAEASRVVRFPPDDATDAEGWVRALLTDLAGDADSAAELLEAVRDVLADRLPEWSMQYNVYGINVRLIGARVTFNGNPDDGCPVPLDVLAAIVGRHLRG